VIISPWIRFDYTAPSYKEKAMSDFVTLEFLRRGQSAYLGTPPKRDEYSEPIRAPASLWTDVANTACESILIWGGGGEIMIDDIRDFSKIVSDGYQNASSPSGSGVKRVVYIETPRACHEEQILNYTIKITDKGQETIAIEEWILARL
jgi:hypothetical protein